MPFSVNNFRAELVGQGARPNLFEVTVPFPGAANPGDAGMKLSFMCKGAQIPGGDIGMVTVPYFGREIKLAGNRTFPEWTITVINDESFDVHSGFVNWMNAINTHQGNEQLLRSEDYQVDAQVLQYGKEGDVIKRITMVNAWPSSIPAIELGWDQNDALEEFTVTWQYDYWQVQDSRTQTT